jgi:hypothetical protein
MKTSMLIFLTCFSVAGMIAQQDDFYAVADTDKFISETTKRTPRNAAYVSSLNKLKLSDQIKSFQRYVANYNVKESDVFEADEPSYYHLDFENANCKISVTYDKNGMILSSSEKYKGVKIPYPISSKIIKENPGWEIDKTQCSVTYLGDKQVAVKYKVFIRKGKNTKLHRVEY